MSQVLALKYRPSSFDKLIGQDAVTQTLSLALNQNRVSHAYLFSGLRGSGKTSTARIFSKALVCENGPTATPCEVCEHCKMANESRHIDIIEMDAASSRKIDDIRDLIEHTKYRPNSARYKIFIIDEVHMLTKEAFNALLKTLEEPPEFVKFILATTDPLKLPATILSRTQHFRFKQIANKDITHHLSHILNLENVNYESEALDMLSRAGNGSLRDTLTLLDQAIIFSKGYITPEAIASMLGLLDPKQLEMIFDTILKGDRTRLIEIIKELENYECEVVIDELIAYLKESFFNSDGRFSTLITERFFRILSESKNLLFLNADNGFVLTLLFFKMIEALHIKTIEEMVESLEDEKFRVPKVQEIVEAHKIDKEHVRPIIQEPSKTPEPIQEEIEKVQENIPEPVKNKGMELFAQLIVKLEDRSYDLATCFKNYIEFISYEEGTLTWSSSAQGEDKNSLKHGYPIIRQFVQEIFGIDTKIKMSQNEEKKKVDDSHANEDTSSMIESIEFNPNEGTNTESCISGHITADKKEAEAKEILNDPFVKKIQEMFEPKEIKIYPKV
ncbi:DNA polymerase III subunit gamma/tau [Sulfurospirillum arcachonense]|uniref:DNA polymerase III subunit gamma/tau n=1 Tax=Sulfurospirillum arcachonense TaxID=57666 RepID=UPI0004697719|nr:DNA polymerase III subunit gamma/tau [Sulfurospirillum arcachonense]